MCAHRQKIEHSTNAVDVDFDVAVDSVVDGAVSAQKLTDRPSELSLPPSGKPASQNLTVQRTNQPLGRTLTLVKARAQTFLDEVRSGALQRVAREELYRQMADVVFSYWATKLHHPAALLDPKRQRRLMARLAESRGDWGLLCYAVDGALRDDYLMGRAVRSDRRYDGVETIFRDRGQVERLAESCRRYMAGEPHPLVAKYAPHAG